ncbi:hypothetical protein BJ508DRAFT_321378 [Ascobolus immersus RN42]|uniref:Borealin N-terminal domain-containing protein n=1 Tax=Ascobolus immersus RN42 TaxID=1160509 RepID=A0A3N4IMZ8_ASCIM|nr:hypothetical protein BJ508DRAFT_321378 [Ascobolus immersus RN42]
MPSTPPPPPPPPPAAPNPPPTPPPLSHPQTPSRRPKSPLRRVLHGHITKVQKDHIISNLRVELEERSRRMRSQYELQAAALRKRIEMRISRVTRKHWKGKMGDVIASTASGNAGVLGWVRTTKRLSDGPGMMALGPVPGTTQQQQQQVVGKKSGVLQREGSGSLRMGRREPSPQKPQRPASPAKPLSSRPPQQLQHQSPQKHAPPTPSLNTLRAQSPLKRTNATIKARTLHATVSTDALERSPAKRAPMGSARNAQLGNHKVRSQPNMRVPDRQGSLKENKVENVRMVGEMVKGVVVEEVGTPGKRVRVLRKRK